MILYVPLEEYLAQWFANDQGGGLPVCLAKGSPESDILKMFLTLPPAGYVPQVAAQGFLPIRIPDFKTKDTRNNFYLPPKAMAALVECIRTRFDLCMWRELSKFRNIFARKDTLIYAFLEKHGIEPSEKNWNAVAKRFQRKQDIARRINSRKSQKKSPTS